MGLFSRQKGKRGERALCASLRHNGFTEVQRTVVNHHVKGNNPDVEAIDPATGLKWTFENKHWSKLPVWFSKLINAKSSTQKAQYFAFGSRLVAIAPKPQEVINIKDVIFEHKDDTRLYRYLQSFHRKLGVCEVLVVKGNYKDPWFIRFFGNWNEEFTLPKA